MAKEKSNKRYLKIENGFITDCITYPFSDYILVDKPNPSNVLAGYWRWNEEANDYQVDEKRREELMWYNSIGFVKACLKDLVDRGRLDEGTHDKVIEALDEDDAEE
jgi:hypothetical protein